MSALNFTAPAGPPLGPGPSSKVPFHCPVCDRPNADFRSKPNGDYNVACWSCAAAGLSGAAFLYALQEAVGAPHAAAVLSDAPRWLGHLTTGPPSGGVGREEPLPTPAEVAGLMSRLHHKRREGHDPEPLRWLSEERGLSRRIIKQAQLGYDGDSVILPMYNAKGEIVAAKRRRPEAGAQMRAWAGKGRDWPLFPSPREEESLLLVAGEWDALCARSHGLPASSVTLGAGHWRDAWTEVLHGRRVFVCFDNNEALLARRRTDALQAAGIDATRLDLRKLGLRTRKGDLSDYLNGGGTAKELRRAAGRLS